MEKDVSPQRPSVVKNPVTTVRQRQRTKQSLRAEMENDYVIPRKQTRVGAETSRNDSLAGSNSGGSNPSQPKDWLKYVKINQFPVNVPTSQKWQAWIDYRRKIRIQLEQCDGASQKAMAALLFTNVGQEVEQIISAKNMFPEEDEVQPGYPFLTNLIASLDAYFRGLSDEAVNFSEFSGMKQKASEAARDYHTRVIRQAEVCELKQSEAMIRNQFLQGMRDRDHAKRAFTDGTPLEEVIAAASRNESLQKESGSNPFEMKVEKQPLEVAAVAAYRDRPPRMPDNRGRPSYANKSGDGKQPCRDCGAMVHRFGNCNAKGKECNKCGKMGHFARVCRQKSGSAVAVMKAEQTEEITKVDILE